MSALPNMDLNQSEAERFLAILDEDAESFCFRVFDDNEKRKDARLAAKFAGTFADIAQKLRIGAIAAEKDETNPEKDHAA